MLHQRYKRTSLVLTSISEYLLNVPGLFLPTVQHELIDRKVKDHELLLILQPLFWHLYLRFLLIFQPSEAFSQPIQDLLTEVQYL
ncbi:hypothetical protein D3C86_1822990 [compost metagenome]